LNALGPLELLNWIGEKFTRVVVLSPHMDDAILSCGGLLRDLVGKQECVTITVCTADPENADPLHPPHGIALPSLRRDEEVAAMQALGCKLVQLNLLDAIYRRSGSTRQLLYPSLDSLWTLPVAEDTHQPLALLKGLQPFLTEAERRPTLFLAPAGIGHHVDHILSTQTLLAQLKNEDAFLLYEDFPYVVDQGAHVGVADSAEKALARLQVRGKICFEHAADVDAKIALIAHYESQIDSIFGSHDNVRPLLLKNSRDGKTLERFWRVSSGTVH
jgi:LmbE family N-acetylglucosaminyl deacetylase